MAEPKWKRALDDLTANPSAKRQKSHDATENALSDLEKGLTFVEFSPDLSDDAKELAKQLRNLVLQNGSRSPSREDKPVVAEKPTIDHTEVPPPFKIDQNPLIPEIPTNSEFPPAPTTGPSAFPPLPPITDLSLMSAPFTHTSVLPYYMPATNLNTYEPLEFLGDAYLELIATRLIHDRFPHHTVGQKAGLREILIRNDNLAVYARAYGFGERVKVAGPEKADTNSKIWTKILADVFEAYVACVILSDNVAGFANCEKWLRELWEPRVAEWRLNGDGKRTADQETTAKTDVKSVLQRYVVGRGVKLEYLEEKPMEHEKLGNRTTFFYGVYLTGWGYNKVRLGSGCGRSKQIAGAEAAKDAFNTGGAIVEDCHRKKVEYDKANADKKMMMMGQNGARMGGPPMGMGGPPMHTHQMHPQGGSWY